MSDLSSYFSDTNGPAYRKEERRSGPPLTYVGEKLRHGLDELHRLLATLESAGGTVDSSSEHDANRRMREDAAHAALHAFSYQITAFLALHNMLGAHRGYKDTERLRRMSREDFDRWLSFVEREGSVLGR